MPLMFTKGAHTSPTGAADPRLMAFFANQLTKGPSLRLHNLHGTQAIKRAQKGSVDGLGAKALVRCRRKVVAKCYGCDRAGL